MLYLYYQAIVTASSVAYIEECNYISEQGRSGYFVGANFYFFIFFVLSVKIIEFGLVRLEGYSIKIPKLKYNKGNYDYFLSISVGLLVFIILLINLFLSPSPILNPSIVTRFTYWENSTLSFLNSIVGNTSVFIPFIFGWIYTKHKKKGLILLLLYIVYLIFIGQKFSPIVRSLYSFFMPIVLISNFNGEIRVLKFITFRNLIIFILMFSVVYFKYDQHNPFTRYGAESPIDAIIYRVFGLQGHLYWGSVEKFIFMGEPKSWDLSELYKGMHTLMRYFWFGDLDHIEGAMQRGFSFTNAYPGILLRIFPLFFAYVAHSILLFLFYIPSAWLLKMAVEKRKYFMSFILFQCFNWISIAFIMAYFNKVIPFILVFIFLIVFSCLAKLIVDNNSTEK